ncbi:MAG: Gfo/Idh/MocA family oxidoreductase [Thermodesulfobacteriota bacterium]
MSNKGKVRVAVIGTGYLGKFHAEKFANNPEAELVAVADVDSEAAARVARACKTEACTRYSDLFGKVDAVVVATPTDSHFSISREFLSRDVDVLIEKPMTATLAEADELIELAESRGLIIQVGHLERFNPAVMALRGVVKKPLFVEAHRVSTYKPRAVNVSVVLDLMIHDIDIISHLAGSPVKQIHAAGVSVVSDHLDIANARIEFASGCVANVTASRLASKNERVIRIFQPDAYVRVDFQNRVVTVVRNPSAGKKGKNDTDAAPELCATESRFEQADALAAETAAFVNSVKTRQAPEVTGQVGRDALFIALSIVEQVNRRNARTAR